jgi:hypothetical protein
MRFFAAFLVLISGFSSARIIGSEQGTKPYYPIIERQQHERTLDQQTMKLKMSQLEQLKLLSYSDDSAPKQMDPFYLGLFETDGTLPATSVATVTDGVNAFVYAELNALYNQKYHPVKAIQTNVLSQTTAASSRRSLQVKTGSHLKTQLNIIFVNEPSPPNSDVIAKVQSIFEDSAHLMYLLTNITARRSPDDIALSRVDSIYFLPDVVASPEVASNPTASPVGDNTDGSLSNVEDPKSPTEPDSSNQPSWKILIPIVVTATIVLAVVALFANQHRRQMYNRDAVLLSNQNPISANELAGGTDDVNLFWDTEDIFSVEAALVETSNNTSKSSAALMNFSDSTKKAAAAPSNNDDQSDIFSGVALGGIDNFSTLSSPRYDSESPRATTGAVDSRSVFSFLSGFASKASTVVASNVTASPAQQTSNKAGNARIGAINPMSPTEGGRNGGTPHSRVSSLFTFSEEDSEDLASSADEREKSKTNGRLLSSAPSDEEEDHDSVAALTDSANKPGIEGVVASSDPTPRIRSNLKALTIAEKYATLMDSPHTSPAVSPAPSMGGMARNVPKVGAVTKGDSAESNHVNCCKEAYSRVCKPQGSYETPLFNMKDEAARLSADEITKELEAAEEERNKAKKVSTHWTMSMFSSPSIVESPAAATFSGTQNADLVSPMSNSSNKSAPMHMNRSANANVIQLQWDDPSQAAMNRLKAAAFVGSVAGNTASAISATDSAGDRYTMMTGRPTSSKVQPTNRSIDSASKERISTSSAGHADGTNIYQIDTAEQGSVGSTSSKGSLTFRRGIAGNPPNIDTAFSSERVRVHTKNTIGDGSTKYQHETMGDWTWEIDNDDPSVDDPDSGGKLDENANRVAHGKPPKSPSRFLSAQRDTPRSAATNSSTVSGLSVDSPTGNADASPSKQLISDLLWLEQKISATNQAGLTSPRNQDDTANDDMGAIGPSDSLSFASIDGVVVSSPEEPDSSNDKSSLLHRVGGSKDESMSVHQAIVCRDCFAPPGKLKIVIHSTKDGPAVHTVKKGSSLEGHIFAGDLIISVDNVDTRSYSAEQVMKMMTAKTRFERKITVLHFEADNA